METLTDTDRFLRTIASQSASYGLRITVPTAAGLRNYYELLTAWNARLHLVAPCSPEEFATRHVLESLFLLKYVPFDSRVIDVGSGGGLPIIPCLIARLDLRATLIESSKRKSVFLRETLKQSNRSTAATVVTDRFEDLPQMRGDFLTTRALDAFEEKLADLFSWAPQPCTLLLYGGEKMRKRLKDVTADFETELLPNSDSRFLFRVPK